MATMHVPAENLKQIVETLTGSFGVRLAGSTAEHGAAEFLASELSRLAPKVWTEEFPVLERVVRSERLEALEDGEWRERPVSLMGASPTTGGRLQEAEVAFFDTATGYQRSDLSFLGGKAVVHLGCHIECEDHYRRLMEAKPAFLLFVDTRFPHDNPLADGLFPAYVRKFGAVPSLKLAFSDAWRWRVRGTRNVRICVDGELRSATTPVLIAELSGTGRDAGMLFAAGHIDTQAGTVGADDNAAGCAAVVELARILATLPHRRAIRLICFGAEEQLSAGSTAYVRKHWKEFSGNGIFMCNFDTFGSPLGWARFTVNARPSLRNLIRAHFASKGIYYQENLEPMPYTDQFPFAACGIPGMWIGRVNCDNGTFYHHRCDDTPDKLDFNLMAAYVAAAAGLLEELSNTEDISLYRGLPEELKPAVKELFKTVYC